MKQHLRVVALLSLQAGLNVTGYFVDVLAAQVDRENHRLREQRRKELDARRKPTNLPGWAQELNEVRK